MSVHVIQMSGSVVVGGRNRSVDGTAPENNTGKKTTEALEKKKLYKERSDKRKGIEKAFRKPTQAVM